MYYFDYNATSPLRDSVKSALINAIDLYGNPSSVHTQGRQARRIIEDSRDTIAYYLGVLPQNIIFTSSATEANHLALKGLAYDAIITSEAEHDSILAPVKLLHKQYNKPVYYIKHLSDGLLCYDSFNEIIQIMKQKRYKPLLSLMKVNNETGIIQELNYFSEQVHACGGYVHSDCVQAIGKFFFDSWLWQCDAITLSAHKTGGAKGVGVLVLRDKIELSPLFIGGGQEMRRRAGTENTLAIYGFKALIDILSDKQNLEIELTRIQSLKDILEIELLKINPEAHIVGFSNKRVANTICLITKGFDAEKQVIISDLNKVSISSGSACSSGKVKASHVLQAYGFDNSYAQSAIRISLGFLTNQQECEALLNMYKKIIHIQKSVF
jgi:cysteine desulfurase